MENVYILVSLYLQLREQLSMKCVTINKNFGDVMRLVLAISFNVTPRILNEHMY